MNAKQPLSIRNISIGEGKPKICVPVVGRTKEEILSAALEVTIHGTDILEWRVDYFNEVGSIEQVTELLKRLRSMIGVLPILFTFRSKKEGGESEISPAYYAELNREAAKTGCVDLVDVELFSEAAEKIIQEVHNHGAKVIVSNHDFQKTPENEELLSRLKKMEELGADIAKIAVMPTSLNDVIRLLSITETANKQGIGCQVVTMSMSEKGLVSRMTGEIFGSALTFGAVGEISAPGQIPVEELEMVLHIIHKHLK